MNQKKAGLRRLNVGSSKIRGPAPEPERQGYVTEPLSRPAGVTPLISHLIFRPRKPIASSTNQPFPLSNPQL